MRLTCSSAPMDDILINIGSEIKSLEDGHVGGYLVMFSDANDPDLAGDYFTKDTNFGIKDGATTPVWLHHRNALPTRDGKKSIAVKEQIGEATLSIDDNGVLIDTVLFNREQYNKMLDSLSWSSGTASHLVDRKAAVGGASEIKQWLLGLDASLTPKPCQPMKTQACPLKSYDALVFPETVEEPATGKATAKKKPAASKKILNKMAGAMTQLASAMHHGTKGLYEDEIAARFDSIYSLCGVLECVLYRMKWMYEAATELGTTFDLSAMLGEVGTEFFARVSNVITGKDDEDEAEVSVEVDVSIGKSLDYLFNNLPQSKQADMFEQAFKDVAKRTAALNSDLKAIITRAAEKQEASEKKMPRRIRERFEDVKTGVDEVATELKSMDEAIDSLLTSPARKALKDLSAELSQIPAPVADTTEITQ